MRLAPLVRPLWSMGTLRMASKHTVIVMGSPRSGTTWLLEMIERATGARRIWEPFFIPHNEELGEVNFGLGSRPYLEPEIDHVPLRRHLERLLEGRDVTIGAATGTHRYSRLELARRLVFAPATVIKFCRLQRLLPWLLDRADVPVIMLIRHPLAVVASMLQHPAWSDEEVRRLHPIICDRIRKKYPELAKHAEQLVHLDAKLAATWAFDYLVPLARWDRLDSAYLVTYENLVRSGTDILQSVLDHLEISGDAEAAEMHQPSASTRGDTNVTAGGDPLETWKRRLGNEQIQRILDVVRGFDIRVYGKGIMPRRRHLPSQRTIHGR